MRLRRPCAEKHGTALVLLAIAFALCGSSAVSAGGPSDRELEELRDAIRNARGRVGAFERRERALFDRLEDIDRRRSELERLAARARADADGARAALAEANARSAHATRRLRETRDAMSRRVVALYKAGEAGPVRALFAGSGSARDLLSRMSALRTVVEHDAELVARFRRDREESATALREAGTAAARRGEALANLQEAVEALAGEQAAKRRTLAAVRADRTQERALLVELEQAARALEETLARLGERSEGGSGGGLDGSGFGDRRGALPPPVPGEITAAFGRVVDAEFQTETFRKGVELAAARGESVYAVAGGEVRFAGWFRGYGKIVILDHGDDYFTVSGHLDEIFVEVGDRLEVLETIGAAGETGSLSGPSLYFEVRRGSRPLDPAEWLGGS